MKISNCNAHHFVSGNFLSIPSIAELDEFQQRSVEQQYNRLVTRISDKVVTPSIFDDYVITQGLKGLDL